MTSKRIVAAAAVVTALGAVGIAPPAVATGGTSSVANSSSLSNQATGTLASGTASTQTSTILSGATGGGFTGGGTGGGFTGGVGGTNTSMTDGNSGTPTAFNMRVDGKAGGDGVSKWGMWAQGLWANVNSSEAYLQMSGNIYDVMVGVDRRIGERLVVGLATGYENVSFTTNFNNGTYKDNGVMLAPYIGVRLTPAWSADASLAYTWLNYTATRQYGSVSGSFDGDRISASTNLTGNYALGNWRFQPKAGLLYTYEQQNSYVDTSGTNVANNGFALGRLSGGGKVGYDVNGIIPYAKVMGEWDFKRPGTVLKANGQQSEDRAAGAVVGLGVEASRGAFTGSLEGNYNSLGRTDLDVWSTVARVRWNF